MKHDKMEKVMHEFKEGTLKSGKGSKVTSRKQAVAIAMAEEMKSKEKKHKKRRKKMSTSDGYMYA